MAGRAPNVALEAGTTASMPRGSGGSSEARCVACTTTDCSGCKPRRRRTWIEGTTSGRVRCLLGSRLRRATDWCQPDDEPRLWAFVCCALALHVSLLVIGRLIPPDDATPVAMPWPHARAIAVDLVQEIARQEEEPTGNEPPGGGSEAPREDAPEVAAPEVPGPVVPDAALAVLDEVARNEGPATAAEPAPPEIETEGLDAEPPALFRALDTDPESLFAEPVRHRAARVRALSARQRAPATAPRVTGGAEQVSRYRGYGPGARGGPGGPGRGYGRGGRQVNDQFVFGGRRGAFRAEVCALPRHTQKLRGLKSCPGLAVFRTDHFNVSPREFRRGFPGVSDRVEWFAIKYEGEFTTRRGGNYRFRLISDDGSILYLNGVRVIDHDGIHSPTSAKVRVQLPPGRHRLKLLYFQGPRYKIALQLFVTPPGGKEKLFGPVI